MIVSSEKSVPDLSQSSLFQNLKIYFIHKNQCLNDKMEKIKIFCSFSEFLQKLNDFVNSDDWIGKIILKSIRLQSICIQ